jgi:nickel-type superoxide dismutase maturation protease
MRHSPTLTPAPKPNGPEPNDPARGGDARAVKSRSSISWTRRRPPSRARPDSSRNRRILRVAYSLAAVSTVVTALVRRFEVAGLSMAPALEPGDRVLVVRWLAPRPGKLVLIRDATGRILIKRVASRQGRQIVVLGDNPALSTDSRHFGPLPTSQCLGVAFYRYWPASRSGWLVSGRLSGSVTSGKATRVRCWPSIDKTPPEMPIS